MTPFIRLLPEEQQAVALASQANCFSQRIFAVAAGLVAAAVELR